MCEYCKSYDLHAYLDKKEKTRVPILYCPVCGVKLHRLPESEWSKTYINKAELYDKVFSEIKINFPYALQNSVLKAYNIPEEYKEKITDIMLEEAYTFMDMVKSADDQLTVIVPRQNYKFFANKVLESEKENKNV